MTPHAPKPKPMPPNTARAIREGTHRPPKETLARLQPLPTSSGKSLKQPFADPKGKTWTLTVLIDPTNGHLWDRWQKAGRNPKECWLKRTK